MEKSYSVWLGQGLLVAAKWVFTARWVREPMGEVITGLAVASALGVTLGTSKPWTLAITLPVGFFLVSHGIYRDQRRIVEE